MKIKLRKPEPAPVAGFLPPNYPASKEFLDSVWGNITRHGIKVMADGRQWVLHCISGQPLERHFAEPFQDAKGNIFWKKKGETLSVVDRLVQSHWQNPDRPTV